MSDSKDLKELLDRLKSETAPGKEDARDAGLPGPALPGPAPQPRRFQAYRDKEPAPRAYRAPEPRVEAAEERPDHTFSENKETMLFGMLAGLVAALGGVLAGLEYLVLAGSVVFSVFALLLAVMLLRVTLLPRRRGQDTPGLTERVDALSRRVEMLSSRAAVSGTPEAAGSAGPRDRELEQKVEELRVLVKGLAKALHEGDK